jgi:hypothetical protein
LKPKTKDKEESLSMLNRTTLLGGVCALALSAIPFTSAMAEAPMGFAGNIGGEYKYITCDGCSGESAGGVDGSGAFGFGQFAGQVDTGYQAFNGGNIWYVGGSFFWAPAGGRLGANVGYSAAHASPLDLHVTNYGGWGEIYGGDALTFGLKGGGLSITVPACPSAYGCDTTGGYVGGDVTGYATPNLAISGRADYFDFNGANIWDLSANVEFLFSSAVPVAIYGGYTYTSISGGGGNANQFIIGVKLYTGAGMTLVENHRNGAVGWIGTLGLRQAL